MKTLFVAGVPAPAPPSTSWATPGAIAGVAVAGAVAVTLIVLLSVFLPRMRRSSQGQVFGQGFPQQHQHVPFHAASGVQTSGNMVTF